MTMQCDRGKGGLTTQRLSFDSPVSIHRSTRCRRKATRWINGTHVGFNKVCGVCCRSTINYNRHEYGFFDFDLGQTGDLCPKYEAEVVLKQYESKEDVQRNPHDHLVVYSVITKEERREFLEGKRNESENDLR